MDKVERWARLLSSPDTLERFLGFIRRVFQFGHEVFCTALTGIEELQYKDARLRGDFRMCLSKLSRLNVKVLEYIHLAEAHPIFTEERREAVSAELDNIDEKARLNIEDKDRFPQTIDFLKELASWFDVIMDKHKEVRKCIDTFDKKTRDLWIRAQDVENQARKRKRIAVGAVASSGIAAVVGAGVLVTGGSLLSGGLLLPVGGASALWSYLALDSYQDQEQKSQDLKEKVDRLQEKGCTLDQQIGKCEVKREISEETIFHYPLLCDLQTFFDMIFEVFEECSNFDQERKWFSDHVDTVTCLT